MSVLLNFAYVLVLLMASPWLLWQAVTKGKYRRGLAAKLFGRVPQRTSQRGCIWFHAVSVGEVNLLQPLLEEIRRQAPQIECVLSTTTITGMELAAKKYPELTRFYCPLDFSWAVRRAMGRIRPDLLVLAELELWPNLIQTARDSGARVAIVNGRLSQSSFRGYRKIRFFVSRVLDKLDVVAVQDEVYARRFRQLGARDDAVTVTGSLKFDGAETNRRNPTTEYRQRLAGLRDDHLVFLAGSTQEPEETLALAAFCELSAQWPKLRLILVPRHPERFDAVARLLDNTAVTWQRRTELVEAPFAREAPPVLLVDTVGELGAWWGTAQIAFVGGSMGRRGGQNMIEPAAYGAAVCFGPKTHHFRDVVQRLLSDAAATVVRNGPELTAFVRQCLQEADYRNELGERAHRLVTRQLGATSRTAELLLPLVVQAIRETPVSKAA